jgi:CUB domain
MFLAQIVQLDFGSFFTEPNADWVTIYDGNSDTSPLIGRLSGVYNPAPIGFRTTQASMFVRFTSDLAVSVRGFNATFTAVTP